MIDRDRHLSATLSQLLIAYTIDFDAALSDALDRTAKEPPPSLAMWANVLRFVGDNGVAAQDLPALSGIAKPTIKSMLDCLQRHGWITIDADGTVRFTGAGAAARRGYDDAHRAVENEWQTKLGSQSFENLKLALDEARARLGGKFPEYPMPAAHRGGDPRGK